MKTLLILLLLAPIFLVAQIDTIPKGNVTHIDSVLGLKIIYPFKNSQVTGKIKAYYISNKNLAYEGESKENAKEGTWNYFEYDSLNKPSVYQFFNYKNDTLNGAFVEVTGSTVVSDAVIAVAVLPLISISDFSLRSSS